MTARMEKIGISLPRELVIVADEVAKEKYNSNRSKLFAAYLQQLADERLQEEMEEGYKALAQENLEFAGMAMDLEHEALPQWE